MSAPVQARDHVRDRLERLVAFGKPTCSVCYRLPADERPEAAEFWPDPVIVYVNNDTEILVDRHTKLCRHHDEAGHAPADATHRVEASTEYIGDEHPMNSAYEYHVEQIDELAE